MFLRRLCGSLLTARFTRQASPGRFDSVLSGRRPLVEPLEDVSPSNLLLPLALPLGAVAAVALSSAQPEPAAIIPGRPVPSSAPEPPGEAATAAADLSGGL